MHLKIVEKQTRFDARIRLAHRLQIEHGIELAEMAEVMGFSDETYYLRLRRLKLESSPDNFNPARRTANRVLRRLQAELRHMIEGEELPDKSKAEALMALARAVKTVSELSNEADASRQGGDCDPPPVSTGDVRKALSQIDRRIEEIAAKRAREILGGGLDANADRGGAAGMAVSGT